MGAEESTVSANFDDEDDDRRWRDHFSTGTAHELEESTRVANDDNEEDDTMSMDKSSTGTAQEVEDPLEEHDEEGMPSTTEETTITCTAHERRGKDRDHLGGPIVVSSPFGPIVVSSPLDIVSAPPGTAQRRLEVLQRDIPALTKDMELRDRLDYLFQVQAPDEAQRQEKDELQNYFQRLFPESDSESFWQNRHEAVTMRSRRDSCIRQVVLCKVRAHRDHLEQLARERIAAARRIEGGVTDSVVIGVGDSETTFTLSRKDIAEMVMKEHEQVRGPFEKHDLNNEIDVDTVCSKMLAYTNTAPNP